MLTNIVSLHVLAAKCLMERKAGADRGIEEAQEKPDCDSSVWCIFQMKRQPACVPVLTELKRQEQKGATRDADIPYALTNASQKLFP